MLTRKKGYFKNYLTVREKWNAEYAEMAIRYPYLIKALTTYLQHRVADETLGAVLSLQRILKFHEFDSIRGSLRLWRMKMSEIKKSRKPAICYSLHRWRGIEKDLVSCLPRTYSIKNMRYGFYDYRVTVYSSAVIREMISSLINVHLDLKRLELSKLRRYNDECRTLVERYSELIRSNSVKAIISEDFPTIAGKICLMASRSVGLKTIELSHGLPSARNLITCMPIETDSLVVFTQELVESIRTDLGDIDGTERLRSFGAPYVLPRSQKKASSIPRVLFLFPYYEGKTRTSEKYCTIVNCLETIIKNKRLLLRIRPHPRENKTTLPTRLQELFETHLTNIKDSFEDVLASQFVVGESSTVLLEACLCNVPALQIENRDVADDFIWSIPQSDYVSFASSPLDLLDECAVLKSSPKPAFFDKEGFSEHVQHILA